MNLRNAGKFACKGFARDRDPEEDILGILSSGRDQPGGELREMQVRTNSLVEPEA